MSRYTVFCDPWMAHEAFAAANIQLNLVAKDEVCVIFGYDRPMAGYFLDVEDDEDTHEFGYARIVLGCPAGSPLRALAHTNTNPEPGSGFLGVRRPR